MPLSSTLSRIIWSALLAVLPLGAFAQIGVGTATPATSAQLDVSSTTKGFLPPRLTQAQRDAIGTPAAGLVIYNTTSRKVNFYDGISWSEALTTAEQPSQGAGVTFGYTGSGPQTYTVPADVRRIVVDARGGKGGNNFNSTPGGNGARVQTILPVTPGEVLNIYVGGQGAMAPNPGSGGGGFNGGGNGTSFNGGGGGATDIRRGGTALADRILVAGGGGGASGSGVGGVGGNLTGGTGGGAQPGQGGTSAGGGAGEGGVGNGALGQGGQGTWTGGGGGYYGGGGGASGGGGGGSSFVTAAGTSATTLTAGFSATNGSLTIVPVTYAAPVLDGSNLINVPGDGLGNHTATQNLQLGTFSLTGTTSVNVANNLNLGANQLVGNGGTSGVAISNAGNVGIGTTSPGALLEVQGTTYATATLDQSQTTSASASGGTDQWQSFTAGATGLLRQLDLQISSPKYPSASAGTLSIYAGEGTGGALLTTQAVTYAAVLNTFQVYTFATPVAVTAGQQYTYRFQTPSASVAWVYLHGANIYAGGRSSYGATTDFVFKTYVQAPQPTPALAVLRTGNVGIGTTTPSQALEVAGQIYSSTGGIRFPDNTVQTTADVADNLGNHTATQKLDLGANQLVGNGGTSGVAISNAGNVGIGTATPGALLDVQGTIHAAAILDQSQTSSTSGAGSLDQWQSFTAGATGLLSQLDLNIGSPLYSSASAGTISIYAGEGTGGALLTTQAVTYAAFANGFQTYTFDTPAAVTAGQQYTYRFQAPVVLYGWVIMHGGDPYAGGRCSYSATTDFLFKTYVQPPQPTPALAVLRSGAVGIGTTTPSQQLEVAGQIYSSTGGIRFPDNTVQTSAALAPDNLGNHTATQKLDLGTNQLVGNNGTSGVAISNAGNVGIGTAAPTQKLQVAGQIYSSTGGIRFPDNTVQTSAALAPDNLGNHTATQKLDLGTNQLVGNNGTSGVAISNAGNVGIGTTAPATTLDVDGGLTVRANSTIIITADNYVVLVGNRSYLRLGSNNATATNRSILLTDGSQIGQLLIITNSSAQLTGIGAIANGAFNIGDTGNVNLAANPRTFGGSDVLTLLWDGLQWLEVSFSNN